MKRNIFTLICLMLTASMVAQSQWVKQSDFPGGAVSSPSSFTINNNGYCGLGKSSTAYNASMYKYDGNTGQWSGVADFTGALRTETVAFAIGNYGYIGLGINRASTTKYFKDFYRYDPSNNSWTAIADFPGEARAGAVAFVIDGKAYVGTGRGAEFYKDMYQYDPATNSWLKVADYPSKLANAVAFAINGKGYICSGSETGFIYNGVDMYDPIANSWNEKIFSDGKLSNRHYGTAFVLDGKAFIYGGNLTASSVITYNPTTNKVENYNTYGNTNDEIQYPTSFVINNKAIALGGNYWSGDIWTGAYVYVAEAWSLTIGANTAVTNNAGVNSHVSVIYNPSDRSYCISGLLMSSEFKIFNINGQVIRSGTITDNTLTVSLSSFEKGIYILQSDDNAIKLIVK